MFGWKRRPPAHVETFCWKYGELKGMHVCQALEEKKCGNAGTNGTPSQVEPQRNTDPNGSKGNYKQIWVEQVCLRSRPVINLLLVSKVWFFPRRHKSGHKRVSACVHLDTYIYICIYTHISHLHIYIYIYVMLDPVCQCGSLLGKTCKQN